MRHFKTISALAAAGVLLTSLGAQAQVAAQPDGLSAFMGMATQMMNAAQPQQQPADASQAGPSQGVAVFGAMMGAVSSFQQMQAARQAQKLQQQQAAQPAQ